MEDNERVVYIVDDDASVRESLCWLLESESYQTRGFASGLEFLKAYQPDWHGCIALDVRMPGMSGLELQEQLLQRGNRLPIIIITGHADVPMAIRAMKAGASDFIEKPYSDELVLESIQRAMDLADRERQVQDERDTFQRRFQALSNREREVLACVVEGLSNKAIADELGVALKTVETHRSRIMIKMKVKSLSDLVRAALFAGNFVSNDIKKRPGQQGSTG